jgi:hypothetical protein
MRAARMSGASVCPSSFDEQMRTILIAAAAALAAAIAGAGAVWYFKPYAPAPMAVPSVPTSTPATPMPTHPQLPRMQVIAQYGGPLQDTLIQRLRDPIDGTTCYLYLPIAVHHTPPGAETGYVEYGANTVGSITCFEAPPRPTAKP